MTSSLIIPIHDGTPAELKKQRLYFKNHVCHYCVISSTLGLNCQPQYMEGTGDNKKRYWSCTSVRWDTQSKINQALKALEEKTTQTAQRTDG